MTERLDEIQEVQRDYDTKHWQHAPGYPTIGHSTHHFGKLLGKIATISEAVDHGHEPDVTILVEEVIPDLLIFAARFANDPVANPDQLSLSELFDQRTQALQEKFSSK